MERMINNQEKQELYDQKQANRIFTLIKNESEIFNNNQPKPELYIVDGIEFEEAA